MSSLAPTVEQVSNEVEGTTEYLYTDLETNTPQQEYEISEDGA
jgi:hypothetical protein